MQKPPLPLIAPGSCIRMGDVKYSWMAAILNDFSPTHMLLPLPCITYIISAKCPGLFYFRASSTASAQCFAIASVKRKSCWDAEWHISQLCMCCKGFVEDLDWNSSEVWIGFNWKYRWNHRNPQKTFIFVIKNKIVPYLKTVLNRGRIRILCKPNNKKMKGIKL